MDLKEVHDRVLDLLDKEIVGYINHEEIDRALDRAQIAEFFDLFGNYQEYAPGRPQARKSYGVTSVVQSALSPFIKPHEVEFESSIADVPDGIEVITSAETSGGNEVDVINETQVPARMRSQIIPPSVTSPVLYRATNKLRILPDELSTTITVWALVRPLAPVFNYTLVDRALTYNQSESTQLEWGEIETERIINRTVSILAQKIQDTNNVQYSEAKTNQGL